MNEFKNLKVPVNTHEKLAARAKALGMKKFVLADALLLAGLEKDNAAIQADVVNAQLKQQPGNTSEELEPPQP
jgi:hypothetical protein